MEDKAHVSQRHEADFGECVDHAGKDQDAQVDPEDAERRHADPGAQVGNVGDQERARVGAASHAGDLAEEVAPARDPAGKGAPFVPAEPIGPVVQGPHGWKGARDLPKGRDQHERHEADAEPGPEHHRWPPRLQRVGVQRDDPQQHADHAGREAERRERVEDPL